MPGQITAIANVVKEGLSLWKTFIATRQESYNRQMDKNKRAAIDCAEQFILLFPKYKAAEDKGKRQVDKQMARWQKKFFRLNQ